MRIYTALQIGEYHLNHCEDYLIVDKIGIDKTLCAVMDGCTNGIDSYFTSTLVGKLLRKISKQIGYKEFYNLEKFTTIENCLKTILEELFKELNIVKNQLLLDRNELLTTLIILLYDKKSNEGIVVAIGDGLIRIDDKITEFEHDNKPDYLGFHLNEHFNNWYENQKQIIFFNNAKDISIATDGIFMFCPVKKNETNESINPIDFLILDNANNENEDMLSLKLKKLEHVYGLKPTDDIAMIRVIL